MNLGGWALFFICDILFIMMFMLWELFLLINAARYTNRAPLSQSSWRMRALPSPFYSFITFDRNEPVAFSFQGDSTSTTDDRLSSSASIFKLKRSIIIKSQCWLDMVDG